MPVLRGAVTFSRFQVEWAPKPNEWKRLLTRGLQARAFEPIDRRGDEERAAGFVEMENNDATDFQGGDLLQGEYALFSYRVDQIKVPAAALKVELEKWAQAFQKEKGRAPARSEKAENRASLRHLLRSRAVPSTRIHDVSWNLKTQQLQIWAASRKAVEEIQLALEEGFQTKLQGRVPAALALALGQDEAQLTPTLELVGGEVLHGEA